MAKTDETSSNSEQQELLNIWSLFKDSSEDIQKKRQTIINKINDDKLGEFPTTLALSTAFDELFQCFSLGGQVKNYYRYGSFSYCKQQREKLWFAVLNGTFLQGDITKDSSINEIEKAKKIQNFYKKRLLEEKATGSSEDIWDTRETLLNNPFKEGN